MRIISPQDLDDILVGASVLGAGGGGFISIARQFANAFKHADSPVHLVSYSQVPPEALLCTTFRVGPVSEPLPSPTLKQPASVDPFECSAGKAVQIAQLHLSKTVAGIFPGEIGPTAVARAFEAASTLNGLFVVDADCSGRSTPSMTNHYTRLERAGIPLSPLVAINEMGESFLIENITSVERSEKLLRTLSQISKITVVGFISRAAAYKDCLVEGSVSLALKIGHELRTGMLKGIDVGSYIAENNNGKVVFHGTVNRFKLCNTGGFTVGHVHLSGLNEWKGKRYRIEVKNENMAAWLDDELSVTIPDLITLFDHESGNVIVNPLYHDSQRVSVVVLPAAAKLTTETELHEFGPSYIGISKPFCSILHKERWKE